MKFSPENGEPIPDPVLPEQHAESAETIANNLGAAVEVVLESGEITPDQLIDLLVKHLAGLGSEELIRQTFDDASLNRQVAGLNHSKEFARILKEISPEMDDPNRYIQWAEGMISIVTAVQKILDESRAAARAMGLRVPNIPVPSITIDGLGEERPSGDVPHKPNRPPSSPPLRLEMPLGPIEVKGEYLQADYIELQRVLRELESARVQGRGIHVRYSLHYDYRHPEKYKNFPAVSQVSSTGEGETVDLFARNRFLMNRIDALSEKVD